ncbi:rRNA methyltransferase [Sphaerisporangium siamense]|uniref:Ribosomal protein RSM22 (Predicted rRNA methylase) n=1 Tax=Sphaerisporangium siamense TaxID=795645 RepID=A0A7W7D794_9ACTN|nr:small ribosomal subunit Rsm22 family protein [Sphaerisporangium siamense]MBB4701550.1 ribosomal protein RSM22 (predicted rRNA methylase) [Sphaerisporangium siamense]GII85676.1 rRNA methyltransferase [Sphaerisporangium siamense]
MITLPDELRDALDDMIGGYREQDLARSAGRLTARYRETGPDPALRSETDVAAYTATRMPATYAAVTTALTQAAAAMPEVWPVSHLDVGGGTGAAVWAASAVWPSLRHVSVIEREPAVIAVGRRLAAAAAHPGVKNATWQRSAIRTDLTPPPADLVTISYVLAELPAAAQEPVVRWLAGRGTTVAIVEPGTPQGYARVLAARDLLVDLGMRVAAPCPHTSACPLPAGDWCHFSARLPRMGLHRRLKAAELGFEDEKFSYVVATSAPVAPAEGRILRHPRTRKGLVTLTLCADGVTERNVSKRHGDAYRAARDATWGDPWP